MAPPELGLLNFDNLCGMPLRAAVLAHHPAGEPLRCPEHGAQRLNSLAASFQAQKFPSANSYGCAGPAARASPSPAQPRPDASTPVEKPSARGGRFPSPAESAVWLHQPVRRLLADFEWIIVSGEGHTSVMAPAEQLIWDPTYWALGVSAKDALEQVFGADLSSENYTIDQEEFAFSGKQWS